MAIYGKIVLNLILDIYPSHECSTGQPRYVKLAYLEYTAYVEVIIHSRIFPLYCTVIRPCLCQTRLSWKLGYFEAIFYSIKPIFPLFTTACIEVVKKWNGPMTNKVIYLIDRTIALISAQIIHCCK